MLLTNYLKTSAEKFPKKIALVDKNGEITFKELYFFAKKIASCIAKQTIFNSPIAVFMPKSSKCIIAFQGILYSGNFYAMLDVKNPDERLKKITNKLLPSIIITDNDNVDRAKSIFENVNIVVYDEMLSTEINDNIIGEISNNVNDTDPAAIYFTSGSTGTPKGVILTHRGIYDFIEWIHDTFEVEENLRMANQTPFYFCMSIPDIFLTLKKGGALYIVPQMLFMFPVKLADFLESNNINFLWWVPTALISIAKPKIFEKHSFNSLKIIVFGGEVFTTKYLNLWRRKYPHVKFLNLYGPTECTDTTHYYEVTREFEDSEPIPLGKSRKNIRELILDENDLPVKHGEIGELCILGAALSLGYYNDPERTREVFVQNPLNKNYVEKMYRTGDLVRYNENNELIYEGRKDFQIKRYGYRIELREIESAANSVDGVDLSCAVYMKSSEEIRLYYTGNANMDTVKNQVEAGVPKYMLPEKIVKIDKMPLNASGKIDRYKLAFT